MENIRLIIDNQITPRIQTIAERIVELQYQRQPELWKPYGAAGKHISIRDAGYHIPFLTEAILADEIHIFTDYISWVKALFQGLKLPDSTMIVTLECTLEVLNEILPENHREIFEKFIQTGIEQMQKPVNELQSYIDTSSSLGNIATQYINFLLQGDRHSAANLIMNEVKNGTAVRDIYMEVF